jgi:hypothetical protein
VPIFLEKFLLPVLAAALILLAITNPMKFDTTQRITGVFALFFAAYFVSHTLHISKSQTPTLIPPNVPAGPAAQTTENQTPPGTSVPKHGTAIHKLPPLVENHDSASLQVIQSLSIEARLTCDLKDGEELPPSEVPFVPVGDANAHLEGPAGDVPITFVSPVRFRHQGTNEVVVINEFAAGGSSAVMQRPVKSLQTYQRLKVPAVTIVWGKSMGKMKLFEVSLRVNGNDVWYYPYKLDSPFQEGPVFAIPLDSLKEKLP